MTSLKGSCNVIFLAGRFCVCILWKLQPVVLLRPGWVMLGGWLSALYEARPMDGSPTSCIAFAVWESSLSRRQRLNGGCHFRRDLVGTWNGIHIQTFACPAALARGGAACVAFPPVLWQPFCVTETQAWFLEGDGHALECKVPLAGFSSQVFELHEHCDGLFIISNIPYIVVQDKEKECRFLFFPCK